MTLSLPKQTNPTSSTKSIITPTIPTSPPFVCKAPEKKNATKGQGGANGKRKCKAASTEKQPTATAAPTMPVPVSGVSPSAPPSSYGAYAYPQYLHHQLYLHQRRIAISGYSPYPYPYPLQSYGYPPPPGGYSYMSTRYPPGQQPYNGLPPPSCTTPYPYLYHPPRGSSSLLTKASKWTSRRSSTQEIRTSSLIGRLLKPSGRN